MTPPLTRHDDVAAQMERRLGVTLRIFGEGVDPKIAQGLWRQAEVAFLDNPLPSLFKERLFVYLARFCASRYCLARHLVFLLERPAGDATAEGLDAAGCMRLLDHELPRDQALDEVVSRLEEHGDGWPEAGTTLEQDLIDCATHVFLRTRDRERCRAAIRAFVSATEYDQLVALLGFAQLTRSWAEDHPELEVEPDVQAMLNDQEALARWIDERWPAAGSEAGHLDEALSGAEARFGLALDAAQAMIYESDLQTDRIVAMFGVENVLGAEVAPQPRRSWWLERIHPDDLALVSDRLADVGRDDRLRLAYRVRHGDDHWVPVVEHGRVVRSDDAGTRLVGVVIDVSALHAIESELRERTTELEAIVENMADGLIVQDAAGEVVRINHAALEAPGAGSSNREEIDARYLICDGRGRPLPTEAWPLEKAKRFEPFRGDEVTIVDRETGRNWTGLFSGVPARGVDGGPGIFVTTFRDVTERKEAENELRASEERLREVSQRKDEFLAMLGHELRNPLSSIRSAADMLHLMPMEDHRVDRLRRVLDRQSAHMAKLVDGLLDAARVVRGKVRLEKERVHLRDVVVDLVADRRAEAEELGVDLAVKGEGHDVYVVADRMRMTQILDNLLSNALKYNRPGGHVRLEISRDGDDAILRVSDDGAGMSPELIAHLFEPFRQGPQAYHRPEGGLGLGLAVVRGLVERHGGRIAASSAGLNRGSTFEVRLPAAAPEAPSSELDHHNGEGLDVLVVEDEPDYADTLRMLLETLGHRVEVARDGNEALARAAARPPDVVLCDLGLPDGMSGYDVAEALCKRRDTRDAYLVALTGYSRSEDRERAERAGFDDFLSKPAGAETIQAALRRGRRRA
jgi:PAS domain S-box-containing protein